MIDSISAIVEKSNGAWHVEHYSQEHLQSLVVWIVEAGEKKTLNNANKSVTARVCNLCLIFKFD